MRDVEIYSTYLTYYVWLVLVFGLILFAVVNLLLLVLKLTKIFYERRILIIVNVLGAAILLAHLIPPIIDIQKATFCVVDNVVKAEIVIAQKRESILITDSGGEIYTCYDFLIDSQKVEDFDYPGVAVFAKHSKMLLDFYPKQQE